MMTYCNGPLPGGCGSERSSILFRVETGYAALLNLVYKMCHFLAGSDSTAFTTCQRASASSTAARISALRRSRSAHNSQASLAASSGVCNRPLAIACESEPPFRSRLQNPISCFKPMRFRKFMSNSCNHVLFTNKFVSHGHGCRRARCRRLCRPIWRFVGGRC